MRAKEKASRLAESPRQRPGRWVRLPLSEIRRENIPGTFKGKGDDVVLLVGKNPDLLKADASKAKSNFIIWGYGDRRNLLVNEIAPYKGTVVIPKGTLVLVIEAEGDWSIEVTTK